MIARIWRGVTSAEQADEYFEYLMETGLKDYRAVPGNRGVEILRRTYEGKAEFLLISLWESYEAILAFAGEDRERAVYYARDKAFLLELEPVEPRAGLQNRKRAGRRNTSPNSPLAGRTA